MASVVQQKTGFATSGNLTVTLNSATSSGNNLLIVVGSVDTITTPTGFNADLSVNNGTAGSGRLFQKATTAGETSWSVTLTGGSGGSWWAGEVSGLLATPLDKTVTGQGNSSSPATGTTAATSQAVEWAIAIITSHGAGGAGSFSSWTGGFTEISDTTSTGGTWSNSIGVATLDLSATGTQSSGATLSLATYWEAGIATYKALPTALPGGRPVDRYRHVLPR